MKNKLLSVILAAFMTAGLLAGCSNSNQSTSSSSTADGTDTSSSQTETATGEVDTSQFINLHLPSNPTMLDPALTSDGQGDILTFMLEPIMRVDKDFNLVAGIAEGYEVNDDATVYTYTIRPDVKFHDGTPCDAEAIKWNYDRQMGDNATPEMVYAETIFSKFEKVEAPDATTVVITLKESDGTIPAYLAMCNGAGLVSPTALQADPQGFQKKPVGAGPYKFVEWIEDQSIKLEAFDEYYAGKAMNAGINFKIIKEPAVQTSEFLAGGIDYIYKINYTDIDQIEAAGLQVKSRSDLGYNFISFVDYETNPIFKDERVRQAIWYALDRTALVNGIFSGRTGLANSAIPVGMYGGDAQYTTYEYDVEKAKTLLTEAGYPDGFEFTLVTRSEPEYQNMCVAIQMELEKIGVKMNIEILQKADWINKIFMEQPDHDMIFFNWGAAANDPSYMAALWLSSNAGTGYNTSGYSNPEFDSLIEQARKSADTAEQSKLYAQAAQMVNDDAAVVFLHEIPYFYSMRPNITDPDGDIGGKMSGAYWWKCSKTAA